MRWAKLYGGFASHPKFDITDLAAGTAVGLHAKAIAFCAEHLTDGLITGAWIGGQLATLSPRSRKQVVGCLLDRGMLEKTEDGDFIVHDYLDHNRSRLQAEGRSERERNRKRTARSTQSLWTGDPA